jgi:hypothetical protein
LKTWKELGRQIERAPDEVIEQIYGQSKKKPDIGDPFPDTETELTLNPASLLEWPNFPSYVPRFNSQSLSTWQIDPFLEAEIVCSCHT